MMNTDTPNTTAAAVKERPILCQGAMVRAIREDRKTQTRRIIKDSWWVCLDPEHEEDREEAIRQCPYGKQGDRLWVREAWRTSDRDDCFKPRELMKVSPIWYECDGAHGSLVNPSKRDVKGRYRHARFMMRWMSRITLEVVGVRVERLQEISEEDAKAEGPLYAMDQEQTVLLPHLTEERNTGCVACSGGEHGIAELCHPELRGKGRPFACWFASLWDSIHEEHTWEKNPWVWVVEFRRVD